MFLRGLDTLIQNPGAFFRELLLVMVALFVVGITVHEFSHALAAHWLGDDTAKRQGRLSLNPVVHLDPMGTIMLLVAGLGWGKPVPVDGNRLRGGRSGMARVALAGPLSNVLAAAFFALPIRTGLLAWHSPFFYEPLVQSSPSWMIADILGYIIFFNILLAVFNLIPVFPLDGFNILSGVVPASVNLSRYMVIGPVLLLLVIGADMFLGTNLLWGLLRPPADLIGRLLVGKSLF